MLEKLSPELRKKSEKCKSKKEFAEIIVENIMKEEDIHLLIRRCDVFDSERIAMKNLPTIRDRRDGAFMIGMVSSFMALADMLAVYMAPKMGVQSMYLCLIHS